MRYLGFLGICILLLSTAVAAQVRGRPEEAKALAIKAADYLHANGPDVAYKTFNDPESVFHKGDLYVFVIDPKGLELAGPNTGENLSSQGFVADMLNVKQQGWVDYEFLDPVTGKEKPKTSYIVRFGDLIVGAGTYEAD